MSTKCKECRAEMKPLFTSLYCPNDCDRPEKKKRAGLDALMNLYAERYRNLAYA